MQRSIKRFGTPWMPHPVFGDEPAEPVPIGEPCPLCHLAMREGDRGLLIPHLGQGDAEWRLRPWHVSCLRDTVGPNND